MKTMISVLVFSLLSLEAFAARQGILNRSPYLGTKVEVEAERITMTCAPNGKFMASISKTKLKGYKETLFVREDNFNGFTIPYYEPLTLKYNLGDQVMVYESNRYTLYQQLFGTGQKTRLESKLKNGGSTTCESTWE